MEFRFNNPGMLLKISALLVLCASLNNCAMRPLHKQSIVDLRNEASKNYSKQIVDAAAGIIDRNELPVMFTVEGGNSVWNPKYESQIGATIAPLWRANTSSLNPGILASETIVDTIQFNDFGSAATYRLNILYTFLCFPYEIETLKLPHGVIFSLFDIRDSAEGLDFSTKLSDGKHFGVPKENKHEFLLFVNDIMNWTRHASPELLDLSSPPGIVYMFLFSYYDNIQTNYSSVQAVNGLTKLIDQKNSQLHAITEDYQSKLKDALNNKSVNNGYMSALNLVRSDIIAMQTELSDLQGKIGAAQANGQKAYVENLFIVNKLKRALSTVAENDMEVDINEVNTIIETLTKRVNDVNNGKLDINMNEYTPVGGSGINANESTEDIYRERFERLPDSIDTSVIRLN